MPRFAAGKQADITRGDIEMHGQRVNHRFIRLAIDRPRRHRNLVILQIYLFHRVIPGPGFDFHVNLHPVRFPDIKDQEGLFPNVVRKSLTQTLAGSNGVNPVLRFGKTAR